VVAGNLIGAEEDGESASDDVWTSEAETTTIEAMAELDDVLAHLSATVAVDIMPGATDPAGEPSYISRWQTLLFTQLLGRLHTL
jgi:hypothetical protein